MYSMKNGVLLRNGAPIFALGQSYYPSYHPQKVPVLEGRDRIAEMRRDLEGIRRAGFQLVRMAALGDVWMDGGEVGVQFDLPDRFCEMCGEMDLAAMIRLQGYSVNLRGFEDGLMLDENGEPMEFYWSWFLRNCINHPGILEDNAKGTAASAAHFAAHSSVVSFQIYNEPAYPTEGFYDYHPHTVALYRRWRSEKGMQPCDPPKQRPAPGEAPEPWIQWRLFNMERLNEFICDMGRSAREGYAAPESLTCHMNCPASPGAAVRGEDYFHTAENMDVLGITAYTPHRGPSYHMAALQLALCESAAATFGKHAWLIEYNARTSMPPQEWLRETYSAIGHGLKGILYYQWRADYPFDDGPEPEGFGLLYNSGEKTPVYDTAVAMNVLVNGLGGDIAGAKTARSGVGVLYSNRQHAYFDALDNGAARAVSECHERSILGLRRLYAQFNALSVPLDFARAQDLRRNPLQIRALLLVALEGLSEAELDEVDAFEAAGGKAYLYQDEALGFVPYERGYAPPAHGIVIEQYDARALLDALGIEPPARAENAPFMDAKLLLAETYALCCLINYDPLERRVENARLRIANNPWARATAFSTELDEGGVALKTDGDVIELPALRYGAIIRFSNR